MSQTMLLKPELKSMIRGGNKLGALYGLDIPTETTGEDWTLSAHPSGDCQILNGPYQGETLSHVWKEHPELFGDYPGDVFPLLAKIIDAKQDLSIQCHPDDAYAKVHENGALGKWSDDRPTMPALRAVLNRWLALFLVSVLKLSAQSFSPFLYFQF